jgi:hypothetical protein
MRIRFNPLVILPILRNMTEKSYYIEFRFTPKQRDVRREAILEVPNDLVRRTQTELMNKDRREKAIVLDLAREGRSRCIFDS